MCSSDLAQYRNTEAAYETIADILIEEERDLQKRSIDDIGSNNCVALGTGKSLEYEKQLAHVIDYGS